MDPEYAAALEQAGLLKGIPLPKTVAETRAISDLLYIGVHNQFLQSYLPPENKYVATDRSVPVEGGQITVRCLVPTVGDEKETFPLLVYIHGGGWSMGNVDMDDYLLRIQCVEHKLSIVNIEYRLAPEHPFPIPLNDCYAALKWAVSNTSLLGADLSKGFLIGGDSAGANISVVLSHVARDDPIFEGRRFTGMYLCEPNICHYSAYPERCVYTPFPLKSKFRSFEEYSDMPTLSRQALDQLNGWYNAPPTDPRFSPLLYPSHRGVPRTYIQAMELDPLRDDAFVYAEVLRDAGVETKLDLNMGVTHAFHYGFPSLPAATKVRENLKRGLEWLLKRA
ncbi:Alpha/Beta hydrolase protein [Cubamyces menziesii]|nr:Alpha/Beta hydrolase protein [Cubamyces menziesii]